MLGINTINKLNGILIVYIVEFECFHFRQFEHHCRCVSSIEFEFGSKRIKLEQKRTLSAIVSTFLKVSFVINIDNVLSDNENLKEQLDYWIYP